MVGYMPGAKREGVMHVYKLIYIMENICIYIFFQLFYCRTEGRIMEIRGNEKEKK